MVNAADASGGGEGGHKGRPYRAPSGGCEPDGLYTVMIFSKHRDHARSAYRP